MGSTPSATNMKKLNRIKEWERGCRSVCPICGKDFRNCSHSIRQAEEHVFEKKVQLVQTRKSESKNGNT